MRFQSSGRGKYFRVWCRDERSVDFVCTRCREEFVGTNQFRVRYPPELEFAHCGRPTTFATFPDNLCKKTVASTDEMITFNWLQLHLYVEDHARRRHRHQRFVSCALLNWRVFKYFAFTFECKIYFMEMELKLNCNGDTLNGFNVQTCTLVIRRTQICLLSYFTE